MAERWRAGEPAKVIAHEAGVSVDAFLSIVAQNRDLFPKRRGRASEVYVDDLAARWARGHTLEDLCEAYGLKRSTVSMLMSRHRDRFPYRRRPAKVPA